MKLSRSLFVTALCASSSVVIAACVPTAAPAESVPTAPSPVADTPALNPGPTPNPQPAPTTTTVAAPAPLRAPELSYRTTSSNGSAWNAAAAKATTFVGASGEIEASVPGVAVRGGDVPPFFFAITDEYDTTTWVRAYESGGRAVIDASLVDATTQRYSAVYAEGCTVAAQRPSQCPRSSAFSEELTVEWIAKPSLQVLVVGSGPGQTPVSVAPGTQVRASIGSTNMGQFPPGATAFLNVGFDGPAGSVNRLPTVASEWSAALFFGSFHLSAVLGWGCDVGATDPEQCGLVTDTSPTIVVQVP